MLNYKDYLFVGIQGVLFVAYIFSFKLVTLQLMSWIRYLGLGFSVLGAILGVVAVLQMNTKLSPFPTPVSTSKLITSGAFAIARHPIYTSILAMTFGYALYQESVYKGLIFLLLLILFSYKSRYEEELLEATFLEYASYKDKTRRFL